MSEIKIGLKLDNRYELKEFIGKGGMALVYRAVDHRTGHDVAVKILRPEYSTDKEFLERFDREALAASKMTHHNIVNLLDVGQLDDIRYLVMEYVKGKTLKEVIQEKRRLPPHIAAQIALRILSALQHAHRNGIIHRDIKPQNILVHSEGHIKVADFGIARMAEDSKTVKEDSVMGSVYYFSPEQARGEEVTAASDIYSVGVVLYEMITGRVPFEGTSAVAVAMMQINGEADPVTKLVPDCPAAMEHVIQKAMEKKPELRYQSALEMGQDLLKVIRQNDDWMGTTHDIPIPMISQVGDNEDQKPHWKEKLLRYAFGAAVILVAASLLGIGVFKAYDLIVNMTEVPFVLYEPEEQAIKLVARAGLKTTITRASDAERPAGTVILQTPEYNTRLRKGETVAITVSTGPVEQEVPDIRGCSSEEAQAVLTRYGFAMLILSERAISREPWDTVVEQFPKAGEMLNENGIVQVTLSGGSLLLQDLTGTDYKAAREKLEKLGITVKQVKEIVVSNPGIDGTVATQQYLDRKDYPLDTNTTVMENSGIQVILGVYRTEAQPETEETP